MTVANPNDWSERHAGADDPHGRQPAAPVRRARPAEADLAFVSSARSADEFARANRHSLLVARLKFGLPIAAGLAVLIVVGAFALSSFSLPSINFGFTRLEDGKLVMDNPHLRGLDGNQRPYRLEARRAIQDSDKPTTIALEAIEATLPFGTDGMALVTAGSGLYDADGKTLSLSDSVTVDTKDGMSVRLVDAEIDIASGALKTNRRATVDTGRAVVSADALTVEEKGKRIVFENRVRMTIRPINSNAKGKSTVTGSVRAVPVADANASGVVEQ